MAPSFRIPCETLQTYTDMQVLLHQNGYPEAMDPAKPRRLEYAIKITPADLPDSRDP